MAKVGKKRKLTRQDQTGEAERRLHLREWMLYEGQRRGRRVSQAEVAKAAGVNEPHISNVLSERKGGPQVKGYGFGIDSLLGISGLFKCSVNDLFKPPPAVLPKIGKLDLDQPMTVRQWLALRGTFSGSDKNGEE